MENIKSKVKRPCKWLSILLIISLFPLKIAAQLPLVTDNAGTLDKGNMQIELSNGLGFYNEHRCSENATELSSVFTYGVFTNLDFVLAYPFVNVELLEDSLITKNAGFSDLSFEFKYSFLHREHLSLAIKPGVSIPTGKYTTGLGNGKFSGTIFLITSYDFSPLLLNANFGYLRNDNKCGDALDIWHISADIDYEISPKTHFVANTGIEKNPDPEATEHPVFGLAGFYYLINENCEVSFAYKDGVSSPETNHAFIYGFTLRF